MLKTDVFVWLTVNCKSLNFCSVDTLSAQLHCHMDYFIYCRHANSTHLPYSSFACNFEFSNLAIGILRSTKSQNFTILLFSNFTQQKSGGRGGGGMDPLAPQVCRPCNYQFRCFIYLNILFKTGSPKGSNNHPFVNCACGFLWLEAATRGLLYEKVQTSACNISGRLLLDGPCIIQFAWY